MPPRARAGWLFSLRLEDIFSSLITHWYCKIENGCYSYGMLKIQELVVSGDEGGLARVLKEAEDRDWGWRGKEGRTSLELAAVLGQSDMVTLMVNAGAPPNQLSASGYSGLHYACMWGQLSSVKQLVRSGADHRMATKAGETPHQLALRYGHSACTEFLLCTEARHELHQAIETARATLVNSELISGKWNKDDKNKVNGLCNEKTQWLAENTECSEEELSQQTTDFHSCMQPHLSKLEPQN